MAVQPVAVNERNLSGLSMALRQISTGDCYIPEAASVFPSELGVHWTMRLPNRKEELAQR
jgi:hypothetical protein